MEIRAAPEALIEAIATSPLLFARAAYHLGNRHVAVQIVAGPGGGRLRFQADHVPVSYTHLDVYKRQVYGFRGLIQGAL